MTHTTATTTVINADNFLKHWQGHRQLTRRVIEAFPEKELFAFSIGGMRPFSEMVRELIGLAGIGMRGVAESEWDKPKELQYHNEHSALGSAKTKAELLRLWDQVTEDINQLWPQISQDRFQEQEVAWPDSNWGGFDGIIWSHLMYFMDNEIHHRGQGYVYLRSLGIEPPFFWERD